MLLAVARGGSQWSRRWRMTSSSTVVSRDGEGGRVEGVVGAWRGGRRRSSGGGVRRRRVDARWCAIRSDNDTVVGVGVGLRSHEHWRGGLELLRVEAWQRWG
ncbi:hypothetical protein U1Q18_026085 [Sarracenia purpurea var. burkii]